jgi:hypothetical protein
MGPSPDIARNLEAGGSLHRGAMQGVVRLEPGDGGSAAGREVKNGVLTTPDLKIHITRYKVIKAGQKGNEYGEKPVLAF